VTTTGKQTAIEITRRDHSTIRYYQVHYHYIGHHLSVTIFIYMLPHLQATTSPVSSEISDLCEISDLLLFISYFASQNKGKSLAITFFICVV